MLLESTSRLQGHECSAEKYRRMEAGFDEIALTQKTYKNESVHRGINEIREQ